VFLRFLLAAKDFGPTASSSYSFCVCVLRADDQAPWLTDVRRRTICWKIPAK
jgi:hypothetical protein